MPAFPRQFCFYVDTYMLGETDYHIYMHDACNINYSFYTLRGCAVCIPFHCFNQRIICFILLYYYDVFCNQYYIFLHQWVKCLHYFDGIGESDFENIKPYLYRYGMN